MAQDTIAISLEKRDVLGKSVKHLRKDGLTPAVIHDHGKASIHVQGPYTDIVKVWRSAGKHHPVEINADGKEYVALIKDVAVDPRKHTITHVVFNAVDKDQKVEAEIPLKPHYDEENESSPAERSGLIVLTQLETVEVRALATKLPDFLEYNAEKLIEIGDHLTVADLIIPEGVELITETNHSIATVYEPSALASANDAAGGTSEAEVPEGEEGAEEGETAEGETSSDEGETKEEANPQ